MKRTALLVVPALGLAALGAGLVRQPATVAALSAERLRIAALHEEVTALTQRARPRLDELADALPQHRALEGVLAALDAAARRAGVTSVTPTATAATAAIEPDTVTAPDATDTAVAASASQLRAVSCSIDIEATFPALVRFLGILETERPLLRVDALQVESRANLVRARATLVAPWLQDKT